MPKKNEAPKQTFSGEQKKRGSPLGHPVEKRPDVFFITTAHEDLLVQAPSRGGYLKIKPDAVLDHGMVRKEKNRCCHIIIQYSSDAC
jgi:hypothetical protein